MAVLEANTVVLARRQELIKSFPCFSSLSVKQSEELSALMFEYRYLPGEKIVVENDLVDSIYIIINGQAEVSHEVKYHKRRKQVPIAVLETGEAIGLNDTGFYSTTGKRTATVIALTDVWLLRLDIKDLYQFLNNNGLESTMYAASLEMLRMRFIKQSLPFAKLSHERLKWLASQVKEMIVPAGTIIFRQGEKGDKCYLIRSGKVGITTKDEEGHERHLALLKPPVIFGEATLITRTLRNATAVAQEECDLLVLDQEQLSELIESEENVASMFMNLMVDRSLPIQNPLVTMHHRKAADGQELTILKNPVNGSYFKLSQEGAFIWQYLNGKHTMQEITLALAEEYKVFAPNVVAAMISKLTQSGFIHNVEINQSMQTHSVPIWVKIIISVRKLLEIRFAFGDADRWITKIYNKYVRFLFTRLGLILLAILAISGFVSFITNTEDVLLFFKFKHVSLLLLLTLIPFSLGEALLHELGHAFAVKAFGREVHYIGVGWYWFSPIAFTDTSDMWLSARKPRMLVNLAGIYVDILIAGLSSLLIVVTPNAYIQAMLWSFALYTYIGAFRMLSPLQEMDGYYVLMDWVEKNHLRQAAVLWLVKKFPQSLRQPHLFREHWPEIAYWLACIIFLICVTILTFLVQNFVFIIMGITSNQYFNFILPFLVLLFSSFSILADIRNQAEE